MGLLDQMFGGSAGNQGLLAGSMALLNAGGPSRVPVSLGQALGQGMGAGQKAYRDAQEFDLQKQLRDAQIKKMKSEEDQKQMLSEAISKLNLSGSADPEKYSQAANLYAQVGNAPMASDMARMYEKAKKEQQDNSEWKQMQASGPTDGTAPAFGEPIRPGAAERFMGPELAVIPGVQQRAMALGNWIQQNPRGNPELVRKELSALDKMVTDYNTHMMSQNATDERAWNAQEDRRLNRPEPNVQHVLREDPESNTGWSYFDPKTTKRIMTGAPAPSSSSTQNKPIPRTVATPLIEARNAAMTIDRLSSTFEPRFASKGFLGYGADAQLAISSVFGTDADAVDWWKNYLKDVALVERHEKFGSALTPTEQASWKAADINPGMAPKVIERNLKQRAELAKKLFEYTAQDAIDIGYDADKIQKLSDRAEFAIPKTNSKGWKLEKDAKGNQAYVSPDRTQFEEVKKGN